MKTAEQKIAACLAEYDSEMTSFAQALRVYLKQKTKPSFELAGVSAQSFNIGYGFTTKAWDCYCAIIVYRKHINLSLPSGASLSDPEGLLHGTGSRIRHLKIKELKDVQTPAVTMLLTEARANAFAAVEDGGSDHHGVKSIIKAGRKKR